MDLMQAEIAFVANVAMDLTVMQTSDSMHPSLSPKIFWYFFSLALKKETEMKK